MLQILLMVRIMNSALTTLEIIWLPGLKPWFNVSWIMRSWTKWTRSSLTRHELHLLFLVRRTSQRNYISGCLWLFHVWNTKRIIKSLKKSVSSPLRKKAWVEWRACWGWITFTRIFIRNWHIMSIKPWKLSASLNGIVTMLLKTEKLLLSTNLPDV